MLMLAELEVLIPKYPSRDAAQRTSWGNVHTSRHIGRALNHQYAEIKVVLGRGRRRLQT